MNRQGHAETLVSAHPGNTNAVKAGIYSKRYLEPRVRELEAAIATRAAGDVARDLLRRELASLSALGEAMDATLTNDGICGRRSEPRTLISLRLRLNEKLRRTLQDYYATGDRTANDVVELDGTGEVEAAEPRRRRFDLLREIAAAHHLDSFEELQPQLFDPDAFLSAVIVAADPATNIDAVFRARRLLTDRKKNRPISCVCSSGRDARDGVEFHEWLEELRDAGLTAFAGDAYVAEVARTIAYGHTPEPWSARWRTWNAFGRVISEALERARGVPDASVDTLEDDPTVAPLWRLLLSADEKLPVTQRLRALVALDGAGALRRCTCSSPTARFEEEISDERYAYVFRIIVRRNYLAAVHRVRYPDTYLAIQEAIDAAVRGERQDYQSDRRPRSDEPPRRS